MNEKSFKDKRPSLMPDHRLGLFQIVAIGFVKANAALHAVFPRTKQCDFVMLHNAATAFLILVEDVDEFLKLIRVVPGAAKLPMA